MELGSSNNLAQHRTCTIFSLSQNHSTLANTTIVFLERKKLQMFSILMFFFPPTFAQLKIVATFAPMGQSKNVGVALIAAKSKQYFMGLLYLFLNDTKMHGYLYLKL